MRKTIFWSSIGLLAAVVAVACLVLFLPALVSTEAVRARIETQATNALRRPVHIGGLSWSWARGIIVRDFALKDEPEFSPGPMLSVGRAHLNLSLRELFRRRAVLELEVTALEGRFVRLEDGRSNWASFLAGLPKGEPSPPSERPPARLPFEVAARARLGPMRLEAEDRSRGRRIVLKDATVSLDAPSLRTASVVLRIGSGVEVDGRKLPDVAVSLRTGGLFSPSGTLDAGRATADLVAVLPGVSVSAQARMAEPALSASVGIDVAEVLSVLGPFLPSNALPNEVQGRLDLDVKASGDPKKALLFSQALTGSGLRASGGILQGRRLGPLWFALRNRGSYSRETGGIEIERGELRLQKSSSAFWSARVARAGAAGQTAAIELGPVSLDLRELLELARPFLPAELSVQVQEEGRNRPILELASGRISGPLPAGPNAVGLKGLRLSVPSLQVAGSGEAHEVRGIGVEVKSLDATLSGLAVAGAHAIGSVQVSRLRVSGSRPVSIDRLDLPALEVRATALRKTKDALAGITGTLSLGESLRVAGVRIEGLGKLSELDHKLEARVVLQPDRKVDLRVGVLSLAFGSGRSDLLEASVGGMEPGGAASISLRDARFSGALGAGADSVSVAALTVRVPSLRAKQAGNRVSVAGLTLNLADAVATLRGGFPVSAGLNCSLELGSLDLEGGRRSAVRDLRIPRLRVSVSDLTRSPSAVLGTTGKFSLLQALSLKRTEIAGLGQVAGLEETLEVEGSLDRSPTFRLGGLRISAASVRAERPNGQSIDLREGLRLAASAREIRLTSRRPMDADVGGAELRLILGDFARGEVRLAAEKLAAERLTTSGHLDLDLTRVPRSLLALAPPNLRVAGGVSLGWDLAGRLPRSGEIPSGAPKLGKGVAFLDGGEATLTLRDVLLGLPAPEGQAIRVAGVHTPSPIRVRIGKGGAAASLDGAIAADVVEELPSIGRFGLPPRASFTLSLSEESFKSLKISQQITVDPPGLRQTLEADLSGIDRLLAEGPNAAWPGLLRVLGGTVRARLKAGEGAGGAAASKGLTWNGPLTAALEARLVPKREVSVQVSAESPGTDVLVGSLARVRGLRANLKLAKSYRLETARGTGESPGPREAVPLSRAVLEPGEGSGEGGSLLAPVSPPRGLVAELGTQFRGTPTLSFDAAEVSAGGLKLNLSNGSLNLRLDRGLPSLEQFRLDLLGGTILGSATLARAEGAFPVRARIAFSGLNGKRLAPDLVVGVGDEEAEVGGQLLLAAPLGAEAGRLIQDMDLSVEFTQIGARALDRFLFALDPSEANEALVKQRSLLRTGTPRWIKLAIRRGNLSLTGELEVKGIRIGLPPIEQVNLAELPGRNKLEKSLLRLAPALRALRIASADTLEVGSSGEVRFSNTR